MDELDTLEDIVELCEKELPLFTKIQLSLQSIDGKEEIPLSAVNIYTPITIDEHLKEVTLLHNGETYRVLINYISLYSCI